MSAHQPLRLATIQQLDPIYVDVPQSTDRTSAIEASTWKEGHQDQNGANQKKVQTHPGRWQSVSIVKGTLLFRDVTVDPTTGSVILRDSLPNPKGVLLPGMFVRAVV